MRIVSIICLGLFLVQGPGVAQDKKATAAEKAAQRLAELLTPGARTDDYRAATGPVSRSAPRQLNNPEVPLPVFKGVPPRLPLSPPQSVKPRNLPEAAPLVHFRADPVRPQAIELPAGPLVRVPSVNVEQPIPLPILAQPQRDRASLADPTLEASVAAALAKVSAGRAAPVPFVPINLPDPFEHSQAVRLRYTPDELPTPPPITPRTPTK